MTEILLLRRKIKNNQPSTFSGGEMPTTCPPLFHCGTHIPIWLNGAHPTVAEGTVVRNTCGHQPGTGCCGIKGSIQVKNCGTFYVYNLKPTRGCSMAHCAGTESYGLNTNIPCPELLNILIFASSSLVSNSSLSSITHKYKDQAPLIWCLTASQFEQKWKLLVRVNGLFFSFTVKKSRICTSNL